MLKRVSSTKIVLSFFLLTSPKLFILNLIMYILNFQNNWMFVKHYSKKGMYDDYLMSSSHMIQNQTIHVPKIEEKKHSRKSTQMSSNSIRKSKQNIKKSMSINRYSLLSNRQKRSPSIHKLVISNPTSNQNSKKMNSSRNLHINNKHQNNLNNTQYLPNDLTNRHKSRKPDKIMNKPSLEKLMKRCESLLTIYSKRFAQLRQQNDELRKENLLLKGRGTHLK